MKRSTLLLNSILLPGLVIGLVASCDGPTPTEAPPQAEPLVIGTTDSVTDLDPAQSYDFHTWEIHRNTMDTLLAYIPGTTELHPGLAEWCEISEDGLEYTFYLHKGLQFPDGSPFTADAVVWSIDRVMRLDGAPSWLVTSFVDHVEKVDDYTVRFVLQEPVAFFPYLVATQPYSPVSPECYLEDALDSDSTCGGIGPYRIARWERDVEMELEANPDYYGTPPAYSPIIVRYYADSAALRGALEVGDVDVVWRTLTLSDCEYFRANLDYNVYEGPGSFIRYIGFNTGTPPFDNPLVRQAIASAVDRETVSYGIFRGTHQPLYSMVPEGIFSHVDAFTERDLDRAGELLAEAGFDENDPLVMELWWTPERYGLTEGDVAAVTKEALEETGVIQVNLQSAEWATYRDNLAHGTMPVFLLGWWPGYLDPDNYTYSFAGCGDSDDLGIFYCGGEMDDLLWQGRLSTDMAQREQLYQQIQQLWAEEVPTIPLTQGRLIAVSQNHVTGVKPDPTMFLSYSLLSRTRPVSVRVAKGHVIAYGRYVAPPYEVIVKDGVVYIVDDDQNEYQFEPRPPGGEEEHVDWSLLSNTKEEYEEATKLDEEFAAKYANFLEEKDGEVEEAQELLRNLLRQHEKVRDFEVEDGCMYVLYESGIETNLLLHTVSPVWGEFASTSSEEREWIERIRNTLIEDLEVDRLIAFGSDYTVTVPQDMVSDVLGNIREIVGEDIGRDEKKKRLSTIMPWEELLIEDILDNFQP